MFFPPPSPGLLQSKHAQARGKNGLYEEDDVAPSELILNEKQQEQQNPSHLSNIRSHRYPGSRRAFQAVENIIHGSNGHLSSSTSVSIEAPKGCLKFLLSHCSYSSSPAATGTGSTRKTALNRRCHTRTPKSARVSRLPRSKPFCFTKENSSSASVSNKLNRVKSSKSSKSSTSETPAVFNPVVESHYEESEELRFAPMAASKIASCSALDHLAAGNGNLKNRLVDDEKSNTSSSKSKTPPLQASFSPEIQCTATMATSATTPACYVSGHLISGVTDKRKCRARGVLAVVRSRPNTEKSNTSSSDTKTPPLQASFSPEIQSTAMAATPACYGAGHLLSGVTDKRKCRARGVLAVAQAGPIDDGILSNGSNDASFEEDCDAGLDNKFSASMLPSPVEASMHWLLSPCHEKDHDKDDNQHSASSHCFLEEHKTRLSPSSPLLDLRVSFDWCNFSNDTSDATNSGTGKSQRSTNSMLISTQGPRFGLSLDCSSSPNVTPYSGLIPPKEEEKHGYNIDGRNSPLSADTLGSENVMQTPKSDSSLERPVMLSCSRLKDHKRPHHLHSEILSITEDLRMASLSPESHLSIWDTNSSSIKFDRLSTPSDSMDLSRFQKILDDRYLWNSNSTFDDVSQSELRISWREGLASRIFEMDEFDSCRCLSDEEEDLNVDAGNVPTIKDGDENKEKLHSPLQCSYAESIATDGGGLAQSTDSDWNLCYKNNLFQV
ncbi:hypothetical protein ERO13_A10G003901v2 [Gossypium hirsutum]|uniref:Uncharacterized protein isoform X2 n=1 Tax=Gossypium hirsutum TaxID=3635 RepID=A0A1U8L8V7_GOSHI|nr:uncharacterized protein LOC107924972 isoform X2 [Gossypium hirsutum]KAG4177860.1 hypothetical protein ERO13_A10G003901v2 [Gossypium hirsutum]